MRITASQICTAALFSLLTLATPHQAAAQITGEVQATLTHSFIVSGKTLPAGTYVFRMEGGSDLSSMTVATAEGKNVEQIMVRESQAASTPEHTELVFRRYGDKEFLIKIYQGGNKIGVAVSEPSKMEKQLQAQGLQPTEHTETAGK